MADSRARVEKIQNEHRVSCSARKQGRAKVKTWGSCQKTWFPMAKTRIIRALKKS